MYSGATRALMAFIMFAITAYCQASRDEDDVMDEKVTGEPHTGVSKQDDSQNHDVEDFNQDLVDLASQLECMNSWIEHFGLLRSNATQLKKGMVQLAGALHIVREAARSREPKLNGAAKNEGDVLVSGLTSDNEDPFDVSLTRTEQVLSHLLQAAQKYHSALAGLADSAYWEIVHSSCGEAKAEAPRVSAYFPARHTKAVPSFPKVSPLRQEDGGGAQSTFAQKGSSTASVNQDVATSIMDGAQEPLDFQQGGSPTLAAQLGFNSAQKGEMSQILDNHGSGSNDETFDGHEMDQRQLGLREDSGSVVQQSDQLLWPRETPSRVREVHGNRLLHSHASQDLVGHERQTVHSTNHHRYAPELELGAQVDRTNPAHRDERRPRTHFRQAVGSENSGYTTARAPAHDAGMDRTQRIWRETQRALSRNTKARAKPYLTPSAASHTSKREIVPQFGSSQWTDLDRNAQDRQQTWSLGETSTGHETISSRLEGQASDSAMSGSRIPRPHPVMTETDQLEALEVPPRSASDAFGFDPGFPDSEYPTQRQDPLMDSAQGGGQTEAPMQMRGDQVPSMRGDSVDSSRSGRNGAAQEVFQGTESSQAIFEHQNGLSMPWGSDDTHGADEPSGLEQPDRELWDVAPQQLYERQIDEVDSAVPHLQPSAVRPEISEPERRGREIIDSSMQQPRMTYEAPQWDPHVESGYDNAPTGASSGDSLAGLQSMYSEESTRVIERLAANLWPESYLTPVDRGRQALCIEGYIAWC